MLGLRVSLRLLFVVAGIWLETSTLAQDAGTPDGGAPMLGLSVSEISKEIEAAWRKDGIPRLQKRGLFVVEVLPGSPAARAGIRPIDVLTIRAEGKTLTKEDEFADWVATLKIGEPSRVTVHRPVMGQDGYMRWRTQSIDVNPLPSSRVRRDALRYGFLRVEDKWIGVPYFDFSHVSSQDRPFVAPKWLTKQEADIQRREWEEQLPRIAVGEHGKLPVCELIQVLGEKDVIIEARGEWIRLTGCETKHLADGRALTVRLPVAIVGTWSYTTITGARRTIFLAAPVPLLQKGLSDSELAELEAQIDKTANRERAPDAPSIRRV